MPLPNVLMIGTTKELLDEALLRSGRLEVPCPISKDVVKFLSFPGFHSAAMVGFNFVVVESWCVSRSFFDIITLTSSLECRQQIT
jgi:hypothetical protein